MSRTLETNENRQRKDSKEKEPAVDPENGRCQTQEKSLQKNNRRKKKGAWLKWLPEKEKRRSSSNKVGQYLQKRKGGPKLEKKRSWK